MNTICISIISNTEQQEILIANLQEYFDGFEQSENELMAFVSETLWNKNETLISEMLFESQFTFHKKIIPQQNWNSVWELNFSPIKIADRVGVRASFHQPFSDVQMEIVINPKMSFGTGHHATTAMMMELMLQQDFNNKSVLDFGSGTGILSILAAKLSSQNVLAIDHEEWAIVNAIENAQLNGIASIDVKQGSSEHFEGKTFDTVLANINLNIIQTYFEKLANALNDGAVILFSGILKTDESVMDSMADQFSLRKISGINKDGWMALVYKKDN